MTGNRKRKWTNHEIELLCKYYGIIPVSDLAVILNRTIHSIHYKAHQLGLKSTYPKGRLPKFIKQLQSKVFHNTNKT